MPTWSAENDLKLTTAIIALHQVKVSKNDCDRLAAIIGDGCTSKAITHRIGKFRDAASKLGLQDAVPVPATPTKKRARNMKANEDQNGEESDAQPKKKVQTSKVTKCGTSTKDGGADSEKTVKKENDEDENAFSA